MKHVAIYVIDKCGTLSEFCVQGNEKSQEKEQNEWGENKKKNKKNGIKQRLREIRFKAHSRRVVIVTICR